MKMTIYLHQFLVASMFYDTNIVAYVDDVEMTESTESATVTVNLTKASGSDVTINYTIHQMIQQ